MFKNKFFFSIVRLVFEGDMFSPTVTLFVLKSCYRLLLQIIMENVPRYSLITISIIQLLWHVAESVTIRSMSICIVHKQELVSVCIICESCHFIIKTRGIIFLITVVKQCLNCTSVKYRQCNFPYLLFFFSYNSATLTMKFWKKKQSGNGIKIPVCMLHLYVWKYLFFLKKIVRR